MSLSSAQSSDLAARLERVNRCASRLGLTRTVADWLLRLEAEGLAPGLCESDFARFLDPRLAGLTVPDRMADRVPAAERIARAVGGREAITVFGDYDCDGMTSTAILTEALGELGGRVTPLLANRFDGGYGVSAPALRRILATDPKLVVTCDCGSSDHESLAELGQAGVDVIVIDHHLLPDRPLPALAFLNPHRPDCGFPFKGLASCGLALSLIAALRRCLGVKLDLRRYLDLVAIGTIADVAPLCGDNRALVRAGLECLARGERPGLRKLCLLAKLDGNGSPITARDVAFKIAPRLNAPGRLGPPDLALRVLLARDRAEADELAGELEQLSLERRQQTEAMTEACLDEIDREGFGGGPALVLGRAGWNPGVVGIVAGRLVDRFQVPVIVIGFEADGIGRGSVRGPAGARLFDALSAIAPVMRRFGGHQAAAGLELDANRLSDLRREFSAQFQAVDGNERRAELKARSTIALHPDDEPWRVLSDLYRLEPCGEANPKPSISIDAILAAVREVSGGHLKLTLELERAIRLPAFLANPAENLTRLESGKRVRVIGDLRADRFHGGAVELFVESLEPIGSS